MAFCGEVGNWNWLEKSGGAPLKCELCFLGPTISSSPGFF